MNYIILKVKLNDDITQFIVFKSKYNVNKFAEQDKVGSTKIDISLTP